MRKIKKIRLITEIIVSFYQNFIYPLFTQKIFFYLKLNKDNKVIQPEKLIYINLKKICGKTSENFLKFISSLPEEKIHTAKVIINLLNFFRLIIINMKFF